MEEGERVVRADVEIGPPLNSLAICVLDIECAEL